METLSSLNDSLKLLVFLNDYNLQFTLEFAVFTVFIWF